MSLILTIKKKKGDLKFDILLQKFLLSLQEKEVNLILSEKNLKYQVLEQKCF